MEYPGKEHTLKDGTLLLIRSLDEADAPVMLDYLSTVFGETCNLSRCPDEVHMTEEEEGGIIRGIKDSPKGGSCWGLLQRGNWFLRPTLSPSAAWTGTGTGAALGSRSKDHTVAGESPA